MADRTAHGSADHAMSGDMAANGAHGGALQAALGVHDSRKRAAEATAAMQMVALRFMVASIQVVGEGVNQLQALPWPAWKPLALASLSDKYSPCLVLPYHLSPLQW